MDIDLWQQQEIDEYYMRHPYETERLRTLVQSGYIVNWWRTMDTWYTVIVPCGAAALKKTKAIKYFK